jgi:hypothetical protein
MFHFLLDFEDYEQRKISRYDKNGVLVDTARVSDGKQPYETGVEHPQYNNGNMIIVEGYDTIDAAKKGHDKWVKTITGEKLPDVLKDCCNAGIAQFGNCIGMETIFRRQD